MATDKETNLNSGLPDKRGLDDVARAEIERRLEPRQDNIVGNYADLQRMGGEALTEEGKQKKSANLADAFEPPPQPINLEPVEPEFAKDGSVLEDASGDAAKTLEAKRSRDEAADLKGK